MTTGSKQGQILAELDKVQLEASVRAAQANYQAAQAARDSSKAHLERNKVDAEGPDVPFLKLNMERAAANVQRRRDVQEPCGRRGEELSVGAEQTSERAAQPCSFPARKLPKRKRKWRRRRPRLKTRKRTCGIPRLSARSTGLVLSRDVNVGDAVSSILDSRLASHPDHDSRRHQRSVRSGQSG